LTNQKNKYKFAKRSLGGHLNWLSQFLSEGLGVLKNCHHVMKIR